MAKVYFEKLTNLVQELKLEDEVGSPIEVRHFFSGAAVYVDNVMCASWSPVGLAFKLSEPEVQTLIDSGEAIPLKYFPNGHIKKGYALFENPDDKAPLYWKQNLLKTMQQVS